VQRLAVSPDGTRLALAIQNERAVRLWRLDELARRLARLSLPLEGPPRSGGLLLPACPLGRQE